VIYILANEETAVEMDLDVLMSELTRSPNPVRFDGAPPVYEPEKTMVASLGSVQGLPDQGVTGQVTIDTLNFYLNDHLGAPQIVVDEAGAVVWQADYEPFGKVAVTADSSMANQFRLAGQYYDDETGLHYNYHRYYDPRTGRYLTPDPIGLAGGINLYAYVQNNPKNSSDFNGLRPGDVYLFSHTQGFAPLIGLISPGGSYGHVAVELSGRRLLTAASRGVEIQKLDIEVANSLSFDIYRPLNKVDERLLEEFANRAVQNNPGGYNISGLFGISDVYDPGIQDEYTCAEVVWDAYAYSGNNLGYMGLLISPNEISRSPKIKRLHWTEVSETLWQNNP
jgi:RHS repeat-associated protein